MTRKTSSDARFLLSLGAPLQFIAMHPSSSRIRCWASSSQDALSEAIKKANDLNKDGWNIYYEVNLSSQVGQRSTASHITALRAVVGDIDAKDGRTIEDCREIVSRLPLAPSFMLFTGGGLQVVYILKDRPAANPEMIATHLQIGKTLATLADGDRVFDLPRIMRLPGFINHPTPQKAARGRQAAKVVVETAPGCTYTLEELAAEFTPLAAAARPSVFDALAGGLSSSPDGPGWFDRLSPVDKNACLADMLRVPAVIALADTSDGDHSPNWRTIVASCARSGAPDAYALARNWAETSSRFEPSDFDSRWASYVK